MSQSNRRVGKLACVIAMPMAMVMMAMMRYWSWWRRYMTSVGKTFSLHLSL